MLPNKHHLLVLALLPILTAEKCGSNSSASVPSATETSSAKEAVLSEKPDSHASNPVQAKASTAIEAGTQVPQPTSGNRNQPGQTEAMKPSAESETEEEEEEEEHILEPTEMGSEAEDGVQGKEKKKSLFARALSKVKKKFRKKGSKNSDADTDTDTDD
jgi:uncharacterized membrane protein